MSCLFDLVNRQFKELTLHHVILNFPNIFFMDTECLNERQSLLFFKIMV